MEFWVVVAAAGAGYVAQYLQSSSDNKDNLLEQKQFPKISTHEQSDNKNLMYQVREMFCPFRRLARKRAKNEVSDEGVFGFRHLNLDSSANFEFAVECKPEDYTGREHTITRNKVSSRPFNSTGSFSFNYYTKIYLDLTFIYTDNIKKNYAINIF